MRFKFAFSRRDFLKLAPAALAPWPTAALSGVPIDAGRTLDSASSPAALDYRLTPHYRLTPPLADAIRKVQPGLDSFVTEKYAEELRSILARWSEALRRSPINLEAVGQTIGQALSPSLSATSPKSSRETPVRSDGNLEIFRARFASEPTLGRDPFVRALTSSLSSFSSFTTAEFTVIGIRISATSPLVLQTRIRYDLVGATSGAFREERIGEWDIEWEKKPEFRVRGWRTDVETRTRAARPIFTDITSQALGRNPSYAAQMLRGTDHWRTVLDAACGIDVYGNNGVAVGDIDNDGFDDLYVCQPAGLPNRLYRNRGDGTFDDITESAGVGVLDSTACALFADFDNNGFQDLLVVRSAGPLLFLNQRNGKFRFRPDAFRFGEPAQGAFTGAAAADYDRDGRLDVYFCLYIYYQGLDQYRFPIPYHDAQNGPPNFLFHNNGDGTFSDVTAASGMNQNNNRFSFAAGWCDDNGDGWPDLYVANDFGRNNFYRNKGDGTFTDIAAEAGVEDVGAGMSVCWFDYDNDGRQDLYVSDMWSAAGKRVSTQPEFQKDTPEPVRALYRKHANGNSLFHGEVGGRFSDESSRAGVEMGRWAWSSDVWDFDHDGYPDLYVATGMISGPNTRDLSSFFWRQVVSRSPLKADLSREYEQGWNAINELIRSDGSWNGYERNVFYVNGRDGTFADASGAVGLDFADDSRAFALADFDHDGRLEIFLKNRTAPQLRILRNDLPDLGDSIAFRLRGTQSNRDAIGAAVTLETGNQRQTKFLQAGSGFLSQHTKELFFGLGEGHGPVRAAVRWPSGLVQEIRDLPRNHRIEFEEGSESFRARAFSTRAHAASVSAQGPPPLRSATATWLIEPLPAPDFALPDLGGTKHTLASFRGRPLLLNFWATWCPACQKELQVFERHQSQWAARGLQLAAINVNDVGEVDTVRAYARERGVPSLILLASEDMIGIYNVLYRYLFDRRRDLGIPTSLLVDAGSSIVKVYQGPLNAAHLGEDLDRIPRTPQERIGRALPFAGSLYGGGFHRNYFTYGVAFFQRGYLDQAQASFEIVVRDYPDYADAHYNLGTLYLKKKMPRQAREHLQRSLQLQPDSLNALNNLGLLAAEDGRPDEAIEYFREAIRRNPKYTIASGNLAVLYRQQGQLAEAEQVLERALEIDPENPELNYDLGMVFAKKNGTERAREYLQKALKLRPDYPEALNNLGVLYLLTGKRAEAIVAFQDCVRVAPSFDQPYLNLANLYRTLGERQKARQLLRDLLKRHPEHPVARKALEELSQ